MDRPIGRLVERERERDLNGAMIAVVEGEADGAKRAIDAVETEHVALALVGVHVELALLEEVRRQQRFQPRRPPSPPIFFFP